MKKTIIVMCLLTVVLITGCYKDEYLNTVGMYNQLDAQHTAKLNEIAELESMIISFETNKSNCENVTLIVQEIINCSNSTDGFVTYEEFLDMSVRNKWLENKIKRNNDTEYIMGLEDNLTYCLQDIAKINNSCNTTGCLA